MSTKKKSYFELILDYMILFVLGGSIYCCIELLFRARTHFSMFIVGGICFIGIGLINEILPWETPMWLQILIGDLFVLVIEFFSGCIVNLWLGWEVWDYSNMPFNIMGQVCLLFAFLWIPVVLLAIIVDDWAKYLLCMREKPRYYWGFSAPKEIEKDAH